MNDRLKSEDELLGLLGNCIIALALLPQEAEWEIAYARSCAEQHTKELNRRFPGWEWKGRIDDSKTVEIGETPPDPSDDLLF